jgi:class 3 adenylate cyclase
MKMLSFGHVRVALLFFVIFFGFSAVAQFLFVRNQSDQVIKHGMLNGAKDINEAISFDSGIDVSRYTKAVISATEFYIIFKDGSLFDYEPDQKVGIPKGLLPPVEFPFQIDALLKQPSLVLYQGPANNPEKWMLYAKRVDGGSVIVGVSEFDDVSGAEDSLRKNLSYFGSSLDSAKMVNPSKLDNFIAWVLVDSKGTLVGSAGRIPLRTDAIAIGKDSEKPPHRTYEGRSYYVIYSPLTDRKGNPVGTAIMTEDVSDSEALVSNMRNFSIVVAVLSIVVFLILTSVYNSRNEKAKRQIRESFANYFSPQILQAILKEPDKLKIGGQRREVTVLFSDIRAFTALAERLPPAALSSFLQEYFNEMTEAVFATEGIVDKYIGDAVMAFWGAPIEQPDQADRAVRTAIDMMSRVQRLQGRWEKEGYSKVDIGIGINLGIAAIGNFGSAKRFDYTVIGDTVNAASRLESLNKEYHSNILISDSVRSQLTIQVSMRDMGEVQIRGKEKPVRVFQVATA